MAWSAGVCLLPQRFGDRLESFVFRTTVGLGAFGSLLFVLGLLGILTRSAVLVASAAAIAGAVAKRRHLQAPPLELLWVALAVVPIFALTLYPPSSWDDTMYHLPYAKTFAETGSIPLIPELRFPVFPQLQELLYTAALRVSNDRAAQAIHLLDAVLLVLAVLSFVRRFAPRSFGAGPVAATALIASPLIIHISAAAYVDVALALFAQLSMHALENWRRERTSAWLTTACACAAFAASTKYIGLFFVVAVPAAALLIGKRSALRPVLVATALSIVIAGPWYVRNFVETGAPLYPLFRGEPAAATTNAASRHLVQTPGVFIAHRLGMLGRLLPDLWRLPWDLSFHPQRYGEAPPLSPLFVLLLPLALVWFAASKQSRPWMILPLLYAPVWLFGFRDRRFLLQALPILAIAGACALLFPLQRLLARNERWRRAVAAGIVAAVVVATAIPGVTYLRQKLEQRGAVPIDAAARDAYIARAYPFFPALRYLNEQFGDEYSVFALYCEQGHYYAEGTMWGDWMGAGAYRRIATGARLHEPARLLSTLNSLGARYLLIDRHRVDVEIPTDEEFRAHFRPVFARARLVVFEIADRRLRWSYSPNLITGGGFDTLDPWKPHLRCEEANAMVRCRGEANLTQAVALPPGLYELTLRTRSGRPGAKSRLQINWLDSSGSFLGTDIEVIDAAPTWRTGSMLVSTPKGATTAVIYVQTHEGTEAWFDDVALRRVEIRP